MTTKPWHGQRRWTLSRARSWLVVGGCLGALLPSCGPPSPSSSLRTVDSSLPCSQEALLSFDPGSPVLGRTLLPPTVQETSSSNQHLVERQCVDHEDDRQCIEIAEREALAAHPGAKMTSTVSHERRLVRLTYEANGQSVDVTFADNGAALVHLQSLRAEGKVVLVRNTEIVPDTKSPRLAVVRATIHRAIGRRTALRLELMLKAQDGDSTSALMRARRRAWDARIAIHSWNPDAHGAFRVELGCTMGPPT